MGALTSAVVLAAIVTAFVHDLTRAQGPSYPNGSIRLVGGRSNTEGNVEVMYNGRWGSICDDEWDVREAYITCRMLGYRRALRATYNSQFGRGREPIWMDNLFCTGRERSLHRCRFDGWGVHDCNTAEAAGVVCDGQRISTPSQTQQPASPASSSAAAAASPPQKKKLRPVVESDVEVRLTGGQNPTEGRVEVRAGNSGWGLLCGDGWGIVEANVVCQQLGFGNARTAIQSGRFGGHHSNMVLSGVKCSGSERNLADCLHDNYGRIFCPGEANIAAVICAASLPDLVVDQDAIERTSYIDTMQIAALQCAMEENCLSSSAYDRTAPGWQFQQRRLLRFTARIGNFGTTDFRPFTPKHAWQWHACHNHYHSMEVFAHFDLIDARGSKVAEGHKASFCLEDNECHAGISKNYVCANYGDQGISVGCVDTYHHNIDCQWVDVTDVTPGTYFLKVSVNPELKVAELSYENNAATCIVHFDYVSAQVYNCTLGRP